LAADEVAASHEISCDVAIVGAGLSGLRAAMTLDARGASVAVLEARDRVGGRLLTVRPLPEDSSVFIDHGGQWVSVGQERLTALAGELGVALFPTWGGGGTVDWRNGQRSTYSTHFPAYWSSDDEAQTLAAVEKLESMAKTVPLDAPWTAPDAAQWDFQPFSEWVAAYVSSPHAQALVERGVTGVFNSGPGPLSLLAALFVTRSAQDLIRHFHPLGADQRFVGGAQQLATKMAQRLNGKVFTNTYVFQINHNDGGVEVIADRITVRARRVIVTLPPPLAGRIRFIPPMPASRDHLTQSTPMGLIIKVHCTYPTRFWHDAGLSGGVTSDEGAIRTTADNSPPSGSPGILVGFIEGAAAPQLAPAPFSERRSATLGDFVRYFGGEAANPIDYFEYSWGDDPFARGDYGGYWTQGLWTTYGPDLRTPLA
jgi:monoamine oxidase